MVKRSPLHPTRFNSEALSAGQRALRLGVVVIISSFLGYGLLLPGKQCTVQCVSMHASHSLMPAWCRRGAADRGHAGLQVRMLVVMLIRGLRELTMPDGQVVCVHCCGRPSPCHWYAPA